MSYYSEEQIKKARSIDLLTYLQTYEYILVIQLTISLFDITISI